MGPGVVGRVARELAPRERLRPVAGRIADRGVDPERLPGVQPVVDHRRDERALARDARLPLDHRGDRDDVVARQVLAFRVGQVHAGEVLPERLELLFHERPGARTAAQLVGGREEEALEARGRGVEPVFPICELCAVLAGGEVVAANPRPAGEWRDLPAAQALGDRQIDHVPRGARDERVEHVAVGHVLAQRVGARLEIAAVPAIRARSAKSAPLARLLPGRGCRRSRSPPPAWES